MRASASTPFFPCPTRWTSGKLFNRKASSSRAGFSSSTMRVLMGIGSSRTGKRQYMRGGGDVTQKTDSASASETWKVDVGRPQESRPGRIYYSGKDGPAFGKFPREAVLAKGP